MSVIMPKENQGQMVGWLIFLWGIAYGCGIFFLIKHLGYSSFILFWAAGIIPLSIVYRTHAVWLESTMLLVINWVFGGKGSENFIFILLLLVAVVLIFSSYRSRSRLAAALVFPLTALWFAAIHGFTFPMMSFSQGFIFGSTVLAVLIYTFDNVRPDPVIRGKTDLILCSHSGNTAHYALHFKKGMEQEGSEVKVHRFHYYEDFKPELKGDNLVLAYPVAGWKPPWPFLAYLLFKLPKGKGKPAFILYSSYGGPENAGVVAWVVLTLKGYRVTGRNWAVYPLNVVTFRLGPKGFWKFADRLYPRRSSLVFVEKTGREFAQSRRTGQPFVFWSFPLFLFGLLVENKWVNIFLYRNYSWKRRCIKCGLCVKACPSQRLFMDEKTGYPKPKGTCALCLLCINICPTNAMQLRFWSEYGNPYSPRWPELVVKSRDQV